MHIAIDDVTRLAYAEVLCDEKATTAIAFLRRALGFFARYGLRCQQLLTDNGSPYRATTHVLACRALGLKHLRTRPRRPQTNGKAERFIRTLTEGWAYGAIYRSSAEHAAALDGWLWHYNHRRRHQAIGRRAPADHLNNLLGPYTEVAVPTSLSRQERRITTGGPPGHSPRLRRSACGSIWREVAHGQRA